MGAAPAGGAFVPVAELKYWKNSESGLRRSRVSPAWSADS
jgi:hypothetical protein